MNKEERKLERRFNAWVDSHEKELRILMGNPKKWELVENLFASESEEEDWKNNPVRPILESFRKVQNQMEDDLEEIIFKAADKFVP